LQQASKPPAVFRFRHFTLLHGGPCAMKMGTDVMLLGAWAQPPEHTAAVLDGKGQCGARCCALHQRAGAVGLLCNSA
jgi:tRNA1(Val) A37 N6-methylase TrmN6